MLEKMFEMEGRMDVKVHNLRQIQRLHIVHMIQACVE